MAKTAFYTDRVINSGQRPTMGESVYRSKVDAPSGTAFRVGCLEAKPGIDSPDVLAVGTTSKRKGTTAQSLGAHYAPQINRVTPTQETQPVLANCPLMRPAISYSRSFATI